MTRHISSAARRGWPAKAAAAGAAIGLVVTGIAVHATSATSAAAQQSLWPADTVPGHAAEVTDDNPVEVGVRFTARTAGTIAGIRFYQGKTNTGTHPVSLWTGRGTRLATATAQVGAAEGWQRVLFARPVPIQAGRAYVASYFAPNGNYAFDEEYFTSAHSRGDLTAPANAGVYRYGGGYPTNRYRATNYWVDVLFTPGAGTPTPPTTQPPTTQPPTTQPPPTQPPTTQPPTTQPPTTQPPTTQPPAGTLPPGVTLRDIDGGQAYFRQWSNSFPTDPAFFPLAVWNQPLGLTPDGGFDPGQADRYAALGINGIVGFYNRRSDGVLNYLRSKGMWAIDRPLATEAAARDVLNGYLWFDEADGNDRCDDIPAGIQVPCTPTAQGRTPATAIQQVTQALHRLDPTRPVYGQYTKPVALGSGLSDAQAAAYVNAVDIVSFDYYTVTDGWEPPATNVPWGQYDAVQNVRKLAGYGKPVWPFIEANLPFEKSQWSGVTPTPGIVTVEAWHAIIAGARGIQFFDHNFCVGCGPYPASSNTLVDTSGAFGPLQQAVRTFNRQVSDLAPVLNAPFAEGYATHSGALNVMTKYYQGHFYVFAAPRSASSQSVTFRLAGGGSHTLTALNEGRTLTATNGAFTDTFTDATTVHIYRVD
jgi:hypothetical protein